MSQNGNPSRTRELTGMSGSLPEPLRRNKNSKMPCLPGLVPVANDTQAVGVIGGIVVSSGERTPSLMHRCRRGIKPCCINGSRTSNVEPSRPINKTFLLIIKKLLFLRRFQKFYLVIQSGKRNGAINRSDVKIAFQTSDNNVTPATISLP